LPKTCLLRKDLTVIRLLVYKVRNGCRKWKKERHGFKSLFFETMRRTGIDGW